MKLLNLISGTQFKRSLLAASVAASCATSAFAALPPFTFDPASLCATGTCSSFIADNIIVSDFAQVVNTSSNTFKETGYLQVAGFQLGGAPVTPDGFNTNYNFYIPFSGTGHTNPTIGGTIGVFDTLTYQFIGKSGRGTGTPAFDSGTVLGAGSLVGSIVGTSNIGGGFVPYAFIDFTFTPSIAHADFFNKPVPFYNFGFASFINDPNEVEAISDGFKIFAGGGSLHFVERAAVPEPTTVALLGLGLLGVAVSRRKSANSKNA